MLTKQEKLATVRFAISGFGGGCFLCLNEYQHEELQNLLEKGDEDGFSRKRDHYEKMRSGVVESLETIGVSLDEVNAALVKKGFKNAPFRDNRLVDCLTPRDLIEVLDTLLD